MSEFVKLPEVQSEQRFLMNHSDGVTLLSRQDLKAVAMRPFVGVVLSHFVELGRIAGLHSKPQLAAR